MVTSIAQNIIHKTAKNDVVACEKSAIRW